MRRLALTFFIVALLVRCFRLSHQSFWVDEAYSIWACSEDLSKLFSLTIEGDRHPPLYVLLIYPLLKLSGMEGASAYPASEFWARLPSALAGAGTVLVTFLLGNRLGGRTAGILAASFLLLSPFHVTYSQEARPYALMLLFVSLCFWLWLQILDEGLSRRRLLGLWVFSCLAFYASYFSFLPWLARLVCLAFVGTRDTEHGARSSVRRALLLTELCSLMTFLPWLVALLLSPHMVAAAKGAPPGDALCLFLITLMNYATSYRQALYQEGEIVFWLALLAAAIGWILVVRGSRFVVRHSAISNQQSAISYQLSAISNQLSAISYQLSAISIICWLAISVASVFGVLFFGEFNKQKYFLSGLVPFAVLLAVGVSASSRPLHHASRITLAILLLLNVYGLSNYFFDAAYQRDDWRGAAKLLEKEANSKDVVVVNAPALWAFQLYYRGKAPYAASTTLGKGKIKFELYAPARELRRLGAIDLKTLLRRHERLWLLQNRSYLSDPHGLLLKTMNHRAKLRLERRFAGWDLVVLRLYGALTYKP